MTWRRAGSGRLLNFQPTENLENIRKYRGNSINERKFFEILEKYSLKRGCTHNFIKFKVSYVFFITEILLQIFQNFTNMLRKSEKLKIKIKFLCSALSPPSHYGPLPITLACHNGNLSACDQKMSRLCHTTTFSLIVHTDPPPPSTSLALFVTLQFSDLVPYST